MEQWKRVQVLRMQQWGGLLRELKFLRKEGMRRSLGKLLRQFQRSSFWKRMHATCLLRLDLWWGSCICQRRSWRFVVITHFLTKWVTRLNGAIIRYFLNLLASYWSIIEIMIYMCNFVWFDDFDLWMASFYMITC